MSRVTDHAVQRMVELLEERECSECGETFLDDPDRDGELTCEGHPGP